MLGRPLGRRREPQKLVLFNVGLGEYIGERRLAPRDGSGFVQDDRVQLVGGLEGFR